MALRHLVRSFLKMMAGWVSEAHEDQVEQQPAGTPVPVEERVDALEHVVHASQPLRKRGLRYLVAERIDGLHPVHHQVGDLWER